MNKVLKAAAFGATVVALATTASAANLDLNIYGASAQGTYWNANAENFLKAATTATVPGMGCASTFKGYADADKKLGLTIGYDCGTNKDTITIRYTSNKSIEGPRAVMGIDPQANDTCSTDSTGDYTRKMATYDGSAFSTACLRVHVGASDVDSKAFTQNTYNPDSSTGNNNKNGTWDLTPFGENLAAIPDSEKPGQTAIGAENTFRPIIVPFSFFLNTGATNVTNLTRQQILLLMSGKISKWSQFGKTDTGLAYPTKRVVVCHRHAGSGTLATLDKAILRGDTSIPVKQNLAADALMTAPFIGFYESSGNMMKCINENGGLTATNVAAIGYADADANQNGYNGNDEIVKYANVKHVNYNGLGQPMSQTAVNNGFTYAPLKYQIIKGQYEFWSHQWMYINKNDSNNSGIVGLFDKLANYASNAPLACPGLGCYWLRDTDLSVKKSDDSSIPTF